MRNRYFIIIALFCLCLPSRIRAESGPPEPSTGLRLERFQDGSPMRFTGKHLAQNHAGEIPVERVDGNIEKPERGTARPDTPEKEENAPKQTEPLKPFVPSEKIPADQGVDFPYDI